MTLTFVRTAELINMEWNEIDFDNHLWRIPAYKMKMALPHIVPLSRQAIELIQLYSHSQVISNLFSIITVLQSR
jgi:integrase